MTTGPWIPEVGRRRQSRRSTPKGCTAGSVVWRTAGRDQADAARGPPKKRSWPARSRTGSVRGSRRKRRSPSSTDWSARSACSPPSASPGAASRWNASRGSRPRRLARELSRPPRYLPDAVGNDVTLGTGGDTDGGALGGVGRARTRSVGRAAADLLMAEKEEPANWQFISRRFWTEPEQRGEMPNFSHGLAGIAAVLAWRASSSSGRS